MKGAIHFLAGFFLPLVLAGCLSSESESRCPEPECGPLEFRDAFFPMAVGNSWTFTDSLFTDSGTAVGGYVRSVLSYQTDTSGTTWWEFTLPPEPYYGFFTQRNDTVFQEIGTSSGQWLPVLRYIPPPGPDTVYFTTPIDDDVPTETSVVPIAGLYSTPAGSFADCASYRTTSRDLGVVHTVICAGIGPVSHDLGPHRKIRLTSYSLIR